LKLFTDLLHLSRNLRRSPASAIAAALTLSLTLGAGASIFSVVDAVLLTPPPFANPDSIVVLGEAPAEDPAATPRTVAFSTFEAWRDRAGSLAAIEAFDGTNFTLTELGAAERVSGTNVTPGFMTLLGVVPERGRTFAADDVGRPVAIVSSAFWRGKLSGDPDVIGRQIVLGGRTHTIVGVLPDRFRFSLNICDVWRPFPVAPSEAVRQGYRVLPVARLAGRNAADDLVRELSEVSRASLPAARAVATPIAAAITGRATATLGVLAGAAVLALLIAFTNLAGLLIVRSIDRRRELAVRSALGAGRLEILKQLLLEAEALVAVGTLGGLLLAYWTTPAIGRLALQQFGGVSSLDVTMSCRVIGALALAAIACAGVCGWLPALVAARANAIDILRRGATAAPRERALRRSSVAGEVALAFVMLLSMALLGRSLLGVLSVSPGFDAGGVTALSVSLPSAIYDGERTASFYSTLQNALEERFGRGTMSLIDEIPLTGDRGRAVVSLRPGGESREAVLRSAAPGYFEVMRIPVVSGRAFDARDNLTAPPRVVLSASLATRLFGQEPPIGRQIVLVSTGRMAEVVGVAGDVKHRSLDEPVSPTIYLPFPQSPSNSSILLLRTLRSAADVLAPVREEVARLDRNLPVYGIRSMQDVVSASPGLPEKRVLTMAFAGFAALAVVLGALGLFGVAAHDVAARRAELALRLALGADPVRILGSVFGQCAVMLGVGLLVGGILSIWMSRALAGVVYGVGRFDVLSAAAAALVLIAAGALAVLPAARRAARTDPALVLRGDS
jgi:putative ABC transport system permease protein